MKTVFIPPILQWGMLRQLPQQIASQFAKNGYKVIFCEHPAGLNTITEVEPNLFVYGNYNHALKDYQTGKFRVDIIYNTWAKNDFWVDAVKPKLVIYHSCDSFDEWKKYEQSMLDKSHIILCTSQYIYNIRKKQHKNVHLVKNGCTSSFIDGNTYMPNDMKLVKNPVFIFAGAIGEWVSTYLIRKVADNYATIFCGCEFGKDAPSNLINLGIKSHNVLINYYTNSDICLLPFNVKSEITLAANPIKLWEYLSCGKPVLATSWHETELEELKGVVFTAKTEKEFIDLSHELAKLSQSEKDIINIKAKEIARNNTWECRFKQIEDLINSI